MEVAALRPGEGAGEVAEGCRCGPAWVGEAAEEGGSRPVEAAAEAEGEEAAPLHRRAEAGEAAPLPVQSVRLRAANTQAECQ